MEIAIIIAAIIGFGATILAASIAAYQSYKTRQEAKSLATLNAKLQTTVDRISTRLDEHLKHYWQALQLVREIHHLALSIPADGTFTDAKFDEERISIAVRYTELEALAQAADDDTLFKLVLALRKSIDLRWNPRLRDTMARSHERQHYNQTRDFEEIIEEQEKYRFEQAIRSVYRRIYEQMQV